MKMFSYKCWIGVHWFQWLVKHFFLFAFKYYMGEVKQRRTRANTSLNKSPLNVLCHETMKIIFFRDILVNVPQFVVKMQEIYYEGRIRILTPNHGIFNGKPWETNYYLIHTTPDPTVGENNGHSIISEPRPGRHST